MIKTITRNLGYIGPLLVKIVCFINDSRPQENTTYHKKSFSKWITGTMKNKESSITYDYATFLIFDYNSRGKERNFNKNQMIMIPLFQTSRLIKFLKESLRMFEYDDTFFFTDKSETKLGLYSDANKYKTSSKLFIRDCMLYSKLTIIHSDFENRDYEGLRIYNKTDDNFFEVTLDQIEEIIFFLEHTDFFNLSQNLMNSMILWISKQISSGFGMVTNCSDSLIENAKRIEEMQIRTVNTSAPSKQRQNVFNGLNSNEIVNK